MIFPVFLLLQPVQVTCYGHFETISPSTHLPSVILLYRLVTKNTLQILKFRLSVSKLESGLCAVNRLICDVQDERFSDVVDAEILKPRPRPRPQPSRPGPRPSNSRPKPRPRPRPQPSRPGPRPSNSRPKPRPSSIQQ